MFKVIVLAAMAALMVGVGTLFLAETLRSIRSQRCIIDAVEDLLAGISISLLYYFIATIATYLIVEVDLLIMAALVMLPLAVPAAFFTLAPIAYLLEKMRSRVCKA